MWCSNRERRRRQKNGRIRFVSNLLASTTAMHTYKKKIKMKNNKYVKSVSSWTNFFLSKVHFTLDMSRSEIWALLDTKWTRYKHSKKTLRRKQQIFIANLVMHQRCMRIKTGANKKYYENKSNCSYVVIEHVLHEQEKSNAINVWACSWKHFVFSFRNLIFVWVWLFMSKYIM